jgi:flagellar basal-body rod protein FlgC
MNEIGQAFGALDTSVSALQAQRRRMDVIASNLANAESTRSPQGGPYVRQQVVFEAVLNEAQGGVSAGGVRVAATVADSRPPLRVHLPGHPDADTNGDVLMPDIRPAEEMADLLSAERAYEANLAAFKITRGLFQKALELGRA